MRITDYHIILLITVLQLSLLLISSRSIPNSPESQCTRPDPNTLRADQMTVVINGFSEHRLPLLRSISAVYSSSPSVAAVILLWCNPSTPSSTLSHLTRNISAAVLRTPSSSLNYRFYPWEIITTRAVLICDDDIDPDPNSITFAFTVWRSEQDRLVGFFARSHAYDVASRSWIYAMEHEKYSIVLTKFMIVNVDYLVMYSCDERYAEGRKVVDEMSNCEDILMNFVVAEESQKGPLMAGAKSGGVRDYGDARNEGVSAEVREVGLSSRRGEHRKRRGECIRQFHRVLAMMPLRYSYGKMVDDVGEQGMCYKDGKLVLCDHQNFR